MTADWKALQLHVGGVQVVRDDLLAEGLPGDLARGEQVAGLRQRLRHARALASAAYALPSRAGSSSRPASIPCRPEAMIALSAR